MTPLNNDDVWTNYIDWNVYHKVWTSLPETLRKVGKAVGVSESFVLGKLQGRQSTKTSDIQVLTFIFYMLERFNASVVTFL